MNRCSNSGESSQRCAKRIEKVYNLALFNRCLVALFAFFLGDKQLNMNIFKGKRGQKKHDCINANGRL